jgi:hypothetical protein
MARRTRRDIVSQNADGTEDNASPPARRYRRRQVFGASTNDLSRLRRGDARTWTCVNTPPPAAKSHTHRYGCQADHRAGDELHSEI